MVAGHNAPSPGTAAGGAVAPDESEAWVSTDVEMGDAETGMPVSLPRSRADGAPRAAACEANGEVACAVQAPGTPSTTPCVTAPEVADDPPAVGHVDGDEGDHPSRVGVEETMRSRMETTNSADDFFHRGPFLRWMDLWAYHMFVRRTRAGAGVIPNVIPFEPHYALARAYAQEVRHDFAIPRIHGYQCPTLAQDPEGNAMMKAILFGLV